MQKTIPNGGNVPVDTGDLANSLLAQVGSMPSEIEPGTRVIAQDIGPALLDFNEGDTLFLGYRVNYARRQNYGFVGDDALGRTYNQSGYDFVGKAAAMWPQIVSKVVSDIRSR